MSLPSSLSSPPFVLEHAGDLTCSLPLHMLFLHLWCLPPPCSPGHLPDPAVGATSTLGPGFSERPEPSLLGNLISCFELLISSQGLQTQVPAEPSSSGQKRNIVEGRPAPLL